MRAGQTNYIAGSELQFFLFLKIIKGQAELTKTLLTH